MWLDEYYTHVNTTSAKWSGIHPKCGGQVRALPNSIKSSEYQCVACGKNTREDEVLIFSSESEDRKLPQGRHPSDVLALSREERRTISVEDTDKEIRETLGELLDKKSIF